MSWAADIADISESARVISVCLPPKTYCTVYKMYIHNGRKECNTRQSTSSRGVVDLHCSCLGDYVDR